MSDLFPPADFEYDEPTSETLVRRGKDPFHLERREWFVNWLATPARHRKPDTILGVARELGVSDPWLYKIRSQEDVLELVRHEHVANIYPHVSEILQAGVETAKIVGKEGSADRRMILQLLSPWTGLEFTQKTESKVEHTIKTDGSFRRMSDEQLIREAADENVEEILSITKDELDLSEAQIAEIKRRYARKIRKKLDKPDPDNSDPSEFIVDADYEMVDE